MEKISLPTIKEEKIDERKSIFVIEPLYPGYGATLGNALRRVLLSSLPGAAITSFKIEGVTHEFTSIPHVKEDVLEIMLNLKKIKINSFSHDEAVVLNISKKGPAEVFASDFGKNSKVEIMNPDVHIATLDKSAKFEMEVTVEFDKGFKPTESNEEKTSEIGRIYVDSAFSPVERVKILVENTRVGKMTNYDKLTLEISTFGNITPHEALAVSSDILIEHYKVISFGEVPEEHLTENRKVEESAEEIMPESYSDESLLDPKTRIEDTNFSPRTTNALLNAGVKTVAGLKRLSDLKLSEIKGLGQKGIDEIKAKLA